MTPTQTQFCGGSFSLPGSSHQYRDDKKHGFLDMRAAIAESCDVYFYKVAERLGIERMASFMKTFGYGSNTGIDIPGEKAGLMASPNGSSKSSSVRRTRYGFPVRPSAWVSGRAP